MNTNNIILVGLPRSGTTLTCHLLNKLPNTVALHEPLKPILFKDDSPAEITHRINQFCEQQRQSLLSQGIAESRTIGGKVPDNHIQGINQETGKRANKIDGDTLKIEKSLSHDFTLIVKHNAFFASILNILSEAFQCKAVIRNPLSVLLSWNSVDMAVKQGYAPAAERFDQNLKQLLRTENDRYQRQIYLLNWYYNQIHENIEPSNIIRYEDIISSGGHQLSSITPNARELNEPLRSKNNNALYDDKIKPFLAEKLLKQDEGGYLYYYSKENIKEILEP